MSVQGPKEPIQQPAFESLEPTMDPKGLEGSKGSSSEMATRQLQDGKYTEQTIGKTVSFSQTVNLEGKDITITVNFANKELKGLSEDAKRSKISDQAVKMQKTWEAVSKEGATSATMDRQDNVQAFKGNEKIIATKYEALQWVSLNSNQKSTRRELPPTPASVIAKGVDNAAWKRGEPSTHANRQQLLGKAPPPPPPSREEELVHDQPAPVVPDKEAATFDKEAFVTKSESNYSKAASFLEGLKNPQPQEMEMMPPDYPPPPPPSSAKTDAPPKPPEREAEETPPAPPPRGSGRALPTPPSATPAPPPRAPVPPSREEVSADAKEDVALPPPPPPEMQEAAPTASSIPTPPPPPPPGGMRGPIKSTPDEQSPKPESGLKSRSLPGSAIRPGAADLLAGASRLRSASVPEQKPQVSEESTKFNTSMLNKAAAKEQPEDVDDDDAWVDDVEETPIRTTPEPVKTPKAEPKVSTPKSEKKEEGAEPSTTKTTSTPPPQDPELAKILADRLNARRGVINKKDEEVTDDNWNE